MKKIIFISFLAGFLMTACEQTSEDLPEPSLKNSDSQTYVFSGKEVETMIFKKLGNVNLTFEEKMTFLMDYIAASTFGTKVKNAPSGRTLTEYTTILCNAGAYYETTDEWVFNVSIGDIDESVHATKIGPFESPQQVGSSASIWAGNYPHFYEQLDIHTVNPYTPQGEPIITNCGNDDIVARAGASWIPSGGGFPFTSAYVDCTGPFITAPNGGSYLEEYETAVSWRSDLIPNATTVKIEVYVQNGSNLQYFKNLTSSTANDGLFEHDDYSASMAGDGFIYKVKITPLQGGYPPYFSEFFFRVINN